MAREFNFLDYDTIKKGDQAMRIIGIDAPEVQNWTNDGVTLAEPRGHMLADLATGLADSMGAEIIVDSGEKDDHDRILIRLQNSLGEDFTDKSYFEGVVTPDTFTKERENDLFTKGRIFRAFQKERGILEDPDDPWTIARNRVLDSERANMALIEDLGMSPLKPRAFNEKEWIAYEAAYGSGYNPYRRGDVEFHTPGAKYDNTAESVWGTSWDQAIGSIKSGWEGMLAQYSDALGNEEKWNYRTYKAAELERQVNELPTYVSSVANVKDWRDAGEYMVGLGGGMTPYLLGIAGSAVAAYVLSPAWVPALVVAGIGTIPMSLVYGGQTYNEMEGGMDDKNAAYSSAAGIIMAALDRLGLHGIFKASQVLQNAFEKKMAMAFMKKSNERIMSLNAQKKKIAWQDNPLGLGDPYFMNASSAAALGGRVAGGIEGHLPMMTYQEALLWTQKAVMTDSREFVKALAGLVDSPQIRKEIGKQAGADALIGMASEGGTEFIQEMTQYGAAVLGSNKDFNRSEAGERALNALIGGTLMGGVLSPSISTPLAVQKVRRLKADLTISRDQPNLERGEVNSYDTYNSAVDNLGKVVTEEQEEDITSEAKQHKEVENKLAKKGVWQWMKDIPKNFISRPLEWYWKSGMHEALGFDKLTESVIAVFSPTNKDVVTGENAWDIEGRLYNKVSNMVLDIVAGARGYLGEANNPRSRRRMQKIFAGIYKAGRASFKMDKLSEEEQKAVKLVRDSLTLEQANALRVNIDNLAKQINSEIENLSGTNPGLTGEQLLLNIRPDKKKVKANQARVREILKSAGYKDKQIDRIISDIIEGPEGASWMQADQRMSINDVKTGASIPSRITLNPFRHPGMEEFGMVDLLQGLEATSRELIHAAVVEKLLGNKGTKLKKTLAAIKAKAGDDWNPKFASDIISAAEIWLGVYNPIKNKKLKEMQANMTSFNLVTLLGTAGPAQFPELWAAWLGRISNAEGGRPLLADFKKMAVVMAKHYGTSGEQIMSRFWKGSGLDPSTTWTPNRLRFGAAGYGGIKFGAIGQMGINAEEIKSNRLRSAVSQMFITVSGIKPLTDISRIGADFIGNDAIMHHLDVMDAFFEEGKPMTQSLKVSYEMIRETRIPPLRTLKLWRAFKNHANNVFREKDFTNPDTYLELEGFMMEHHKDLVDVLNVARKQWVDNSLANPNPSSKSRVSNDPHYALLFQFRGYILTFAASIVPRLIKRAVSGNPNQDVNAILTMAGLMAMGFLAAAMKDEWKTEGRPYWIDDLEYTQRGIQASGMLGPFDFLLDAVNPIYGEASIYNAAEGVFGPTWGNIKQFSKIGKNTIAGDSDAAIEAALKFIPIYGHKQRFRQDPIGTLTGGRILGEQ